MVSTVENFEANYSVNKVLMYAYVVITFQKKIRLLFSLSTSQPSCSSFVHLMCTPTITSLLFGCFLGPGLFEGCTPGF